jgi:hypothetical protein
MGGRVGKCDEDSSLNILKGRTLNKSETDIRDLSSYSCKLADFKNMNRNFSE